MQELNKKALSEIVSTVSLVVITLAAVALAASQLFSLVNLSDIQSSPTYNCLDLQTKPNSPLQITKSCLNAEGEVEVTLRRSTEEIYLSSISFTLGDESWTCSKETCDAACEILPAGSSRTYYLSPDSVPQGNSLEVYIATCKIDDSVIFAC